MIMDKVDLPIPFQFAGDGILNDRILKFADIGDDGPPQFRWRGNNADIPDPGQ